MIHISPRLILCSLLCLAAAPFARAADDSAQKESEPQKALPAEVLQALFPEAEQDPAKISAEAFLRMARRAPAGESWAKLQGLYHLKEVHNVDFQDHKALLHSSDHNLLQHSLYPFQFSFLL